MPFIEKPAKNKESAYSWNWARFGMYPVFQVRLAWIYADWDKSVKCPGSGKPAANGKDAHCETESEGSRMAAAGKRLFI